MDSASVTLIASDGEQFEVSRAALWHARNLQYRLSRSPGDSLSVPEVDGAILALVVRWLTAHAHEEPEAFYQKRAAAPFLREKCDRAVLGECSAETRERLQSAARQLDVPRLKEALDAEEAEIARQAILRDCERQYAEDAAAERLRAQQPEVPPLPEPVQAEPAVAEEDSDDEDDEIAINIVSDSEEDDDDEEE